MRTALCGHAGRLDFSLRRRPDLLISEMNNSMKIDCRQNPRARPVGDGARHHPSRKAPGLAIPVGGAEGRASDGRAPLNLPHGFRLSPVP